MTPDEASANGIPMVVTMNQQDRLALGIVKITTGELVFADWGFVDEDYAGHPLHLLPQLTGDRSEWTGQFEDGRRVIIFEIPLELFAFYRVDVWQENAARRPDLFALSAMQAAAEESFVIPK